MPANPQFWNKIAESYAAKPVERPEAFERKIAITRDRMTAGDVVLDIGCGTGSLALRLCDIAGEMHGLDVSSEMVRIARDKTRRQGAENVHFHCGPFDETFGAFEPGTLDGVCAYSILHLVDDAEAAIARIHELLRPGGFFISSTVCLGDSWVPYGPILAGMRLLRKAPMVKQLRRKALTDAMRTAGFVEVHAREVGAESMIAFIVATKPA